MKKILSMLLAVLMMLSLFAVPAFAEETPLYEYFGYGDETEFMEYEFWYAYDRGFTYEEAEAQIRAKYAEILANPQIAYDYWETTPEELEQDIADGRWSSPEEYYFEIALEMAYDESWNFTPPVSVQLDGEKVIFTDAAPEITDGRTMVPFRAIAEEMGFTVSFDNGAIVGSDGETSVAFTVGETACVVTKASGEETITMDTAPYIKEDRTYVPVRFFAEAMGMTVSWDDQYKVAVIYDKEALIEKMNQDFTIYNEIWSLQKNNEVTPEDFEMMISMAMNVTVFSTLDGDTTYPVNLDVTFIKEGNQVEGSLVLDIMELVGLIGEISGASEEEMEEALMGLENYLEEIKAELIINMDEGKAYIHCPVINYILALEGEIAITEAGNAWLETEQFATFQDEFNSEFSEIYAQLMEVDSMGELIMLIDSPEDYYWASKGMEIVKETHRMMKQFCGDDVFTKKGNEYIATWDYTMDELDSYYDSDEGYFKGTMKLNTKTNEATIDMEIRTDMDYSSSILMKITGKSKDNDVDMTVNIHVENSFMVEFDIESKMSDVTKSPLSEPPKGASIIDIDEMEL